MIYIYIFSCTLKFSLLFSFLYLHALINISVDILRDPGADSGARESWNGQKKKWAKKSQGQNEKPLGKVFLQSSS